MQLTENERTVLEALRKKAANEFGITLIDDRITLRFSIDKKDYDVNMLVTNIINMSEKKCYNCGIPIYGEDAERKVKCTIETCVGEEINYVHLCYDCYCPK